MGGHDLGGIGKLKAIEPVAGAQIPVGNTDLVYTVRMPCDKRVAGSAGKADVGRRDSASERKKVEHGIGLLVNPVFPVAEIEDVDVIAGFPGKDIAVAHSSRERVRSCASPQAIRTVAAIEGIVARFGLEPVAVRPAFENVVTAARVEHIVSVAAAQSIVGVVVEVIQDRRTEHHVQRVAVDEVVAHSSVDEIGAVLAIEGIVTPLA